MAEDIELRRAADADLPAVLDLLSVSLGNRGPDDPAEQLFSWKHLENPFGLSPSWVAVAGGRLVAFRTFMRWRFRRGYENVLAVRAVDTVTHPDYRGRGLFRALTTQALGELTAEGVGFVFNTPNDQSRPGYLKMGWQVVGRLPISARPRGIGGALRMLRARQPAALWSDPVDVGIGCDEWLAAGGTVETTGRGLRTDRDTAYLRWRYSFPYLHYRVWRGRHGDVVFRVRRRGLARELAVLETTGRGRREVPTLLRRVGADYAVGLGAARPRPAVPLPNQGPLLTWRGLTESAVPPPDAWALSLGDIELF